MKFMEFRYQKRHPFQHCQLQQNTVHAHPPSFSAVPCLLSFYIVCKTQKNFDTEICCLGLQIFTNATKFIFIFKHTIVFSNSLLLEIIQGFALRWLERVLVLFDALYLEVKIFRLELASHDQILPQNNDNIKVSIFGRFLKKFVAMATQLGFKV